MPARVPYDLPTLPNALRSFLGTHPYQFPALKTRAARPELQVLSAVIAMPGSAPANISDASIAATLPPVAQPPAVNFPPLPTKPQPVYEAERYGEGQTITIVYGAAGGDVLALPRASLTRTWLLIINDTVLGTIRVNFDSPASASVGIPVPQSGNLFWDVVVPQNNIHIFAPGAGNVQIAFINSNIQQAQ